MAVIQQVRSHVPRGEVEAGHRRAILEFLERASDPFDRTSTEPGHLVASAVVIAAEARKMAFVLHSRLGRWLQPGGHVEPQDRGPASTALREAREEIGLSMAGVAPSLFDLDVHVIPATNGIPEHVHFDLRFLCKVRYEPLTARTDALEARWFSRSETVDLQLDEGLVRVVAKCAAAGLIGGD